MTAPAADPDCLFCRIVSGDIPAALLASDDTTLAFRDIEPQAPVHFLVVPRSHYPNAAAVAAHEPDTMAHLVATADRVAREQGVESYRLVFNTGADANQTVFHAHLHVLGGRSMTWPPG